MDMSNIPPEYLAEIQRLQRQRQMAEAMQQQGFQQKPTEMVSGHAVRQSPLAGLVQAGTGAFGAYRAGQAEQGLTGIQSQIAQALQGESGKLASQYQTDPRAAIVAAMGSKFPQLQKQGGDWQKQYQERVNQFGQVVKERDPQAAGQAIQSQSIPPNWTPSAIPSPQVAELPGVGPVVNSTNVKGEVTPHFPPKGTNTNVTVENKIQGKEGEMALDTLKTQLTERQKRAQIAVESIQSNRQAMGAIQAGAQAGGGGEIKQSIRKAAQAFGVQSDENTPTEELKMALGNAVLNKARALAPVTDEDFKRLQSILGSINTDPAALSNALSVYNKIAVKELKTYNRYVDENGKNLSTPYARDLFVGAKIGYEPPEDEAALVTPPKGPISLDDYLKGKR